MSYADRLTKIAPADLPGLVEEIRKIAVFTDLPQEHLEWFVSNCMEARFAAGEVVYKEGTPAEYMSVFLEGSIFARRESDGADSPVFIVGKGDVTGLLPFSRMTHLTITGRAEEPVHLLLFHSSLFNEMLHRMPTLGKRLVGLLTDRVREMTRSEQQRDKLAALGKLSAGLAHELNNPAAAAARASDALLECLTRLRKLDALPYLSETNCASIAKIETEIRAELQPPAFKDQLERSDREESITSWLEGHKVPEPWKLSPLLVDANLTADQLERYLDASGVTMPTALSRFATMLEMERIIGQVAHSTRRISTLVKAIKEYSYMDQSPVQEVDIVRGLETTIAIMDHKLKKGITVIREFAPNVPKVTANGGELNQVWTNLIDNAADAMKDKGTLRIRVSHEGEYVLVEIIDNGSGIPEDVQPHIFEPFFTTKGVGDGTGLGLDSVQRIVRKTRGSINFESVPGETRFQVRIPIH
ncbi:MAG TPA: ATP-binding protein, partial [Candidatus Acidoferrum sp.]|nr:ATP-binding protein [Candidatus Acidoferrum sp.]